VRAKFVAKLLRQLYGRLAAKTAFPDETHVLHLYTLSASVAGPLITAPVVMSKR